MNPQRSNRSSLNVALAIALAGALLAVPTLARAGDGDNVAPDVKFLRSVLKGIGLKRGDEAPIKYEERAPLVIPSNDNLPLPQKPGAAIANNPAWPKDPDVMRAKAWAKREQQFRDPQEQWAHDNNVLRPDQLTPGLKKGQKTAGRDNEPSNPSLNKNGSYQLTPSELGFHGNLLGLLFGKKKDDSRTAQFTGEPQRTSLTEPPPGYQTPSPNQPYGVGKEQYKPKAENYYLTHGTKHQE